MRALLLALLTLPAAAQIIEPTTAPASGNTSNPTNVVYFAASGNDANACTQAAPCLSQTKFNTLLQPGNITVLFKGGDYFPWSSFGCQNHVTASSSTTYSTNPVACSNVTMGSYGTGNAIFEGAVTLPLTSGNTVAYDGNGTYVYTYTAGSLYAENIFIDKRGVDSAVTGHLLNEPNGPAVAFANGTTYYPGQIVSNGGRSFVVANLGPTAGNPSAGYLDRYRGFTPGEANVAASGIANVQANPGSTYNDTQAGKLYLHLLDGSSPVSHVVQASISPIGLRNESVNGWYVSGITFEKYIYLGLLFANYSDATATNGYWTNINNQVVGINAWDNTSEVLYHYTNQSSSMDKTADVAMEMLGNSSARDNNADFGMKVLNSTFGRGGSILGDENGGDSYAAVFVEGFNSPEVGGNTAVTYMHNAFSVRYDSNPWIHDNVGEGQNRGCVICYSNNHGLLVERNQAGYGAGDAYQGGGSSTGTGTWNYGPGTGVDTPGAYPMIVRYNLCNDFGYDSVAYLYNCFDTNTNTVVSGMLFDHNTIINSDSGGITFEVNNGQPAGSGVINVTFRYNVLSQNKNYPVYGQDRRSGATNNSNAIYFAPTVSPGPSGFFHSYINVGQLGGNNTFASHAATSCQSFFALVNDTSSICLSNSVADTNKIVVNMTSGDYRVPYGSPAANQPAAKLNLGSAAIGYTAVYGSSRSGKSSHSGSTVHQ